MKILAIPILFCAILCAQAPGQNRPAVSVNPGAPAITGTAPQNAAAAISPDTVVVEVDGKKYTAAEVDKLIAILPPQYQPAARAQPQNLGQVLLMQRLAQDAEKAGLDQKAPYKEDLEFQRLRTLSTAELSETNNTIKVTSEDEHKYYEDNQDKFKEVRVKVIHIGFKPAAPRPPLAPAAEQAPDGKQPLNEAEAKAKIEDAEKQIKAGADFGRLAHDISDDKGSAEKDGDFGLIKQDSAYPPAIKNAVFALKQGEVSAPIREPNGFYLIRAEEIKEASFNEAFQQISQLTRRAKYDEWLRGMQSHYTVKVENPAYFSGPASSSGPKAVPTPVQQSH